MRAGYVHKYHRALLHPSKRSCCHLCAPIEICHVYAGAPLASASSQMPGKDWWCTIKNSGAGQGWGGHLGAVEFCFEAPKCHNLEPWGKITATPVIPIHMAIAAKHALHIWVACILNGPPNSAQVYHDWRATEMHTAIAAKCTFKNSKKGQKLLLGNKCT